MKFLKNFGEQVLSNYLIQFLMSIDGDTNAVAVCEIKLTTRKIEARSPNLSA